MKMGKLCKWGKVVLAGFVLPVAMVTMGAASYAMAAVDSPSPVRSLEEILNSPDIQLSEKAKVGGRVSVVENLEEYYGEKFFTLKGGGAIGSTAYYAVKTGCVKAGAKLAGKKIAEIGARVFGKKVTVKVTPKVDPLAKPPTVRPWKRPMIRDLYKASKDFLKISGAVEVLERLGEAVRRKDYEEAQKILMCEVTPKALSEHIPGFPSDILILVCDKAMPMTVDGIREAFEFEWVVKPLGEALGKGMFATWEWATAPVDLAPLTTAPGIGIGHPTPIDDFFLGPVLSPGPVAAPTPAQPQPIVRGLDNKSPLLVSTSYTPRSISLTFNEPMGKGFCITIQTSAYGFFADPVGDWSGEWSNNHKTFTLTHGTNLPPGSTVTYVINDPNIPPPGKFSDFSTNLAPTTTGGFIVKTSQLVTPIKK
ncbi:hypothetical protein M1M90_01935 [Thermodesulfovibrionales bacterium]|nr:hypothetical protein [Thermodesulfovibrionales bacterium]